ncbi:MAG: VOC family protein [Chryseolinea sp.]
MKLNPYLNFPGTTEQAFNFYKSIFGGEFIGLTRFKDVKDGDKMPPAEQNMLMHVALPIGKDTILMATDTIESMGQKINMGNNVHLVISVDSKADADKYFNALSAGGKINQPLADQFWGAYFGMCIDKFGVYWMVSYDPTRP